MPTTTRRPSPGAGSSRRSTDRAAAGTAVFVPAAESEARRTRRCSREIARTRLAVWCAAGWGMGVLAQTSPAAPQPPGAGQAAAAPRPPLTVAVTAEPSAQPDTLVYFNRPIVTLKATVLGRQ